MGYTHYWTGKKVTDDQWNEFVDVVKKMHESCTMYDGYTEGVGEYMREPIAIKDGLGEGNPCLGDIIDSNDPDYNKQGVIFNGDASTGDDHETLFMIRDDENWTFCKTARKPYDLLVVGVLCAAKDILKYETSTDGDLEDWMEGVSLYVTHMYDEVDRDVLMSIIPEKFYKRDFEVKLLN